MRKKYQAETYEIQSNPLFVVAHNSLFLYPIRPFRNIVYKRNNMYSDRKGPMRSASKTDIRTLTLTIVEKRCVKLDCSEEYWFSSAGM